MIKFSFLDPAMAIRICEAHWTWKSLIYSLCNPRKRQVSNGHFSTVNGHCRGSETCSRNLFSFFWLLFILWTPVAQTDWNKMLTRNKRHLSKRPSRTIEVTGLDFWDATVRDRLSRTDAVGSFIICYVQSDKSRGVMMMTCGNMIVLRLIRMSMIQLTTLEVDTAAHTVTLQLAFAGVCHYAGCVYIDCHHHHHHLSADSIFVHHHHIMIIITTICRWCFRIS